MLITKERLRAFSPHARADVVEAIVSGAPALTAAGITTPLRVQHFLAQVATETGGLAKLEENLNYSVVGLKTTFGRHRISEAECLRYGRTSTQPANQEAIANIVYGGVFGREELGNTAPGDGWRYRGSGALQTTGRENFRKAGHENDPDSLRRPVTALLAALQFWTSHNLNLLADQDALTAIRKAVNGGAIGLDEARAWLALAKRFFI